MATFGDNLVPIGRFSRVCRLSIKALRHYDDLGLLAPAQVDPRSGYRYYRLDQVAVAELIRALRAVEMPLDEIGEVLRASEAAGEGFGERARALLERHREALLGRIAAQQGAVAQLDALLSRAARPVDYEIALVQVPVQRIVGRRLTIDPADLGRVIPREIDAALGTLAARGIDPAGPPIVAYHEGTPRDDEMLIEIGWPVDGVSDGATGLEAGTIGGGLAAHTVHRGPYDQLSRPWTALMAWMQAHGHESAGAGWESYHTSRFDVPDDEAYRTDIFWPVR